MLNLKTLTRAAFTTVALLSLGFAGHSASAEQIVVTRGPHGAISTVERTSLGATVLPTTPSLGYPTLVTRGPGGAAHIVDASEIMKAMPEAHAFPNLMTFGPNGASHITN